MRWWKMNIFILHLEEDGDPRGENHICWPQLLKILWGRSVHLVQNWGRGLFSRWGELWWRGLMFGGDNDRAYPCNDNGFWSGPPDNMCRLYETQPPSACSSPVWLQHWLQRSAVNQVPCCCSALFCCSNNVWNFNCCPISIVRFCIIKSFSVVVTLLFVTKSFWLNG